MYCTHEPRFSIIVSTNISKYVKAIDWRANIFRILAMLVVYLFITTLVGSSAASPFSQTPVEFLNAISNERNYQLHRWHDGQWTALAGILLCGTIISLILNPRRKPVLMQFFVLSAFVFGLLLIVFDRIGGISVVVPFGLLIAAYPNHRLLMKKIPREHLSRTFFTIAVVMGVVLLPVTLKAFGMQIDTVRDEHDGVGHWAIAASLGIIFVIAGFFVSLKQKGWITIAILLSFALLYLGVSALFIPNHDGSWGTLGGTLAIVGSIVYWSITVKGLLNGKTS